MRNSIGWVCIGTLLFARAAVAADWLTEPSVGASAEYNDNPFLTTQSHNTVLRTVLQPALRVKRDTELSSTQADFWLRFDRYPDESDANSNNWGIKVEPALVSDVSHLDISLDMAKDSTLETELLDTGLTQTALDRRSLEASPSWYYLVSQNTSVGFDYNYSTVNYESSTVLTDYRYQGVSGSVAHHVNSTTVWSFVVYGSDYSTDDNLSKFWNTGFQVGLDHDFTERSNARVSVGARRTSSRNEVFSNIFRDRSSGGVLEAKMEHQFNLGHFSISVSRDIEPSGAGYLQQSDLLSFGWVYGITSNWRIAVDAWAYHHKSLTDYRTSYDRHYGGIQPRLEWQWAERWTATGYARYARSKYVQDPDAATANVVGVQVNYRWSGADL